ncbi:MAG: glycosyltransferase [Candidatus Doudnabacteria bacterium]
MPNLAIVIPTYNEKENIRNLLNRVLAQQKKILPFRLSIIIADSHSPDGTRKIVRKITTQNPNIYLLDLLERGIGIALKRGYDFAVQKLKTDVLLSMDADLSHNPDDIPKFITKIQQGFDFIQASRFIPGGENRLEFYRDVFSRGANFLCRAMLGVREISDFTPSFRAFTTRLYQKTDLSDIPWQKKSYIFQPSFAYALYRAGAKVAEVPIAFTDRKYGKSKLNAGQYIWDLLEFTAKIRLKKLKILRKQSAKNKKLF